MSKLVEKVKEKLEPIREKLSFREFINLIKGREDAQIRPMMILDPKNKLTSSNLSELQVDFVTNSFFIAKYFDEFSPMREYADLYLQVNESKEGWAVQKVIEYEQAVSEKRLMQLGLKPQEAKSGEGKTNATKE